MQFEEEEKVIAALWRLTMTRKCTEIAVLRRRRFDSPHLREEICRRGERFSRTSDNKE
jgi:hypothetical protein